MKSVLFVLVAMLCGTSLAAQSATNAAAAPAPADIDSQSHSRLPLVPRTSLDANGQRIYDQIQNGAAAPRLGPPAASMHSVVAAEPYDELNQVLRRSVITPKYFELCTLIAAREFDSEYEWSGHEPAAVRAGVAPEVIDRVRWDRDVTGLPEKDAVVIQFGRTLFRQHKVGAALYAKVVEQFGRQGLVDITLTLGDYVMTAFLLNAVDQQLQPGRTASLPARSALLRERSVLPARR